MTRFLFLTLLFTIGRIAIGQDIRVLPCADLYPFYHGVASGDPLTDRVIIWTRVSPDEVIEDVEVTWRMALDTGMTQIVAQGSALAEIDRDLTVKVDVTGLQPNTFYYYDFQALESYSLRGRTKTLASGNLDRVRMAVAACSNYEYGFFNGYKYLAERNDIDVVVHLGDYIYEYATGGYSANIDGRVQEPANETITLEDYRIRHSHYKLDPDLRAAHQQFPWITVWDDHESANDAWFNGAQNHNAGEGDWVDRKAASKQAYYEWLPVRGTPEDPLYRRFQFGDLVRLMMLDTRLEARDEQVEATSSAVNDPTRTLLGDDQKDWLETEFISSMAAWNIIGQQVMVAPLTLFGAVLNPDQWDGYQADRNWLYNRIQLSSLGSTIVLTGDIHTAWANELPLSFYNAGQQVGSVGVEFVCTSVTSPGLPFIPASAVQVFNAHVRYVDLSNHGFIVVEATPEYVHSDYVYMNTLDSPGGGFTIGASYRTNQGSPYVFNAGVPLESVDFDAHFAPECPYSEPNPDEEEPTNVSSEQRMLAVTGVYPNPFRNTLQVQLGIAVSDRLEVRLLDRAGGVLFTQDFGQMEAGLHYLELHLPDVSDGFYLLECRTTSSRCVHRVLRMN
jgi:alkaline phosphatase D